MVNDNIREYALKLLKRKNYFIKELYLKLLNKYPQDDVSKVIKELIKRDLLNDKLLMEMKIYFFLHIKLYGRKYMFNYFLDKGLSENLVKYLLSKYSDEVFINNMNKLIQTMLKKGKNEVYIVNYLLRKGYSDDEIKKICNIYYIS